MSRLVIVCCSREVNLKQRQFLIPDCHVLRWLKRDVVWQTCLCQLVQTVSLPERTVWGAQPYLLKRHKFIQIILEQVNDKRQAD